MMTRNVGEHKIINVWPYLVTIVPNSKVYLCFYVMMQLFKLHLIILQVPEKTYGNSVATGFQKHCFYEV